MLITEHPPHRTGRAAFPHPAPSVALPVGLKNGVDVTGMAQQPAVVSLGQQCCRAIDAWPSDRGEALEHPPENGPVRERPSHNHCPGVRRNADTEISRSSLRAWRCPPRGRFRSSGSALVRSGSKPMLMPRRIPALTIAQAMVSNGADPRRRELDLSGGPVALHADRGTRADRLRRVVLAKHDRHLAIVGQVDAAHVDDVAGRRRPLSPGKLSYALTWERASMAFERMKMGGLCGSRPHLSI
jgi:hypothetical protein